MLKKLQVLLIKIVFLFLLMTSQLVTNAQVGIGTNNPNASAKLEILSANKGFLPPRVTLTGTDDITTIASPATGLMVYNTATAGTAPHNVLPGYYYYNGSVWVNFAVPYAGATAAVNLGAYDLTVNGLTVGLGAGGITTNTVMGSSALAANSSGTGNTAIGFNAMYANIGGYNNSSFGYQSMQSNRTGAFNTAIGLTSLFYNNSGSYNTVVGYSTLSHNIAGNYLTAIGTGADVSVDGLTNATAIGNGAVVTASNSVRIGNTAVTTIGGQVSWTAASDIRLKKNIENTRYGLSTVMQLRPVDYNLISNNLRQVGFIAQEVKKLVPEVVTGKEGDIKKGEILGITYANLVPVLTRAIQEQQKQIETQDQKLEAQQKQIDELKALVETMLKKNK